MHSTLFSCAAAAVVVVVVSGAVRTLEFIKQFPCEVQRGAQCSVDSVDSVYSVQRDCSFGPDKQNAAAARAQRQWGPLLTHTLPNNNSTDNCMQICE